jgi:hypothetical protein
MMYDRLRDAADERHDPTFGQTPLVYYAPPITRADARSNGVYRDWENLIAFLRERHGERATAAVFPCGAVQIGRPRTAGVDGEARGV